MRQNQTRRKGLSKAILLDKVEIWNSLNKINSEIPWILYDGGSGFCVLVKDVNEDLKTFVLTGKPHEGETAEPSESTSADDALLNEYQVFPADYEQALINHCLGLGLTVRYCRQKVEYKNYRVTIKYLKVINPESGVYITLIPWFMLIGRPYFIFTYVFGIWHYSVTEQKSLEDSAAAAGKVFGNTAFDKSTLKRNIKSMENFIDISRINEALSSCGCDTSTGWPARQDYADVCEFVTEAMMLDMPFEALKEVYGEYMKPNPEPIRAVASISLVLKNIPDELSKVIKTKGAGGRKSRDSRKRLPRRSGEKKKRVQRPLKFVEEREIEKIRKDFIAICRHIVLYTAVTYHQFLV